MKIHLEKFLILWGEFDKGEFDSVVQIGLQIFKTVISLFFYTV